MALFAVIARHAQAILLYGMENPQGLIQEGKEQKEREEKRGGTNGTVD